MKSRKNNVNRKYKDSLFCFLFGNEEYKNFTLDLYNAVNGSSYTNTDDIRITTIKDIIYINVKNDVSFLFTGKMNFYEHQSTFNPNMPVRMFIYAGRVYNRFIKENELNIYSSSVIKLPLPKCVCFYNGSEETEEKFILKLSDSFSDTEESDIEIKVTMLNINYGDNKNILNNCKPLAEYSYFIDDIRNRNQKHKDIAKSVSEAINNLPEDFKIKPILESHRAEVMSMCVLEYTQEQAEKFHKAEIEQYKKEAMDANLRADSEKTRADSEKTRADSEKTRADSEKTRADSEKTRADSAETRADNTKKVLIEMLKNTGKTDEEIQDIIKQIK